ncbi:MAG: rod shape-determining protein MreC [Eubacteriales bacterium]|nr:rod shape-determining protein MreC [Eubacteriales bacterium]
MESKRSKYILIGLSLFCVILIVVTSFVDGFLNPLRTSIGFFLNPIQSGVNRAGTSLYNGVSNYSSLKSAMEEKQALQSRIDELIEENSRLQSEQFELQRLREMYELDQDYMQYEKIGARVIAKDSGDWFQVFRINKGSADGVRVDANVIAGGGLVGIVTDVGANYATVRSIIDDVSRVSGMAQQSGDSCIVAGDLTLFDEGRLRITNIAMDGDVKDGDRIVTSNISSKFLPGILIGYAADITADSTRLTKSGYLVPAARFDSLQEVLVITTLKEDMTQETEADGQGAGESQGDGA